MPASSLYPVSLFVRREDLTIRLSPRRHFGIVPCYVGTTAVCKDHRSLTFQRRRQCL